MSSRSADGARPDLAPANDGPKRAARSKTMFIQTEATPNPATLKFLPGRTVLDSGTLEMRDRAEAVKSPLAERLFNIPGVGGVFLGSDFLPVTKHGSEWPQITSATLRLIMEHLPYRAPG